MLPANKMLGFMMNKLFLFAY